MKHFVCLLLVAVVFAGAQSEAGRPPRLTGYAPVPAASVVLQAVAISGSGFSAGLVPSIGTASSITSTRFTLTAFFPLAGTYPLFVTNPDRKKSNTITIVVPGEPVPDPQPPPPLSTRGPQPALSCLLANVFPGDDLPAIVSFAPAGTAFCLAAGTYRPTRPIRPNAAQTLHGIYGAVIDCALVVQGYDVGGTACLSGWNASANTNVVIRNLFIQNLAVRFCVGTFGHGADGWTVDHVQVTGCEGGVIFGNNTGNRLANSIVTDSHCNIGGYNIQTTTYDNNLIARGNQHDCKWANGWGLRITGSTFEGFTPDSVAGSPMIWFDFVGHDGFGVGPTGSPCRDNHPAAECLSIIDGNVFRTPSTGWPGVDLEGNNDTTFSNNALTMNADWSGVLSVQNSQRTSVHDNAFTAPNGGGVQLFRHSDFTVFPVSDNRVIHNTFLVGGGAQWIGYQCGGNVTTAQCLADYAVNGNLFDVNAYKVPSLTGRYWYANGVGMLWSEWQSLGQDQAGTVQ